tara:strand:+ start:7932 stop:8402 length:471 start_codon:yes stop_codon:yes gene_type:complete
MNVLETNLTEKNRIRKLHLQEQTSSSASGAYETPMAWQSDGELTQSPREEIISVELGLELPSEVDITGGDIGGFGDREGNSCSSCGDYHDGPCDYSEMSDEIDDITIDDFNIPKEKSDVLPDSLLNLFGDVNVDGDLEIEMEEEPKKLRGARKFRR